MTEIIYKSYLQFKYIIEASTMAIKNTLTTQTDISKAKYFAVPVFLIISFIGIKLKDLNAMGCTILLTPLFLSRVLLLAINIKRKLFNNTSFEFIGEKIVDFITLSNTNITYFVGFIIVLYWLLIILKKPRNFIFYSMIIFLYCDSFMFSNNIKFDLNSNSLVIFLYAAPIIFLLIHFEVLVNLILSVIFSFIGLWGLLNLAVSFLDVGKKNILEIILNDIFLLNHDLMNNFTIYFLLIQFTAIFSQFSFYFVNYQNKKPYKLVYLKQ